MSTPAHTADETELLGELAALGMGLAERLHDVAQTTEDPEALARLGAAFHQVSRSVRQSLALQARFASGWVPAGHAPEVTPRPSPAPAAANAAPARERTGWDEYERLEDEQLIDELDLVADLPEDEPVEFARLEAALEAGVARLRRGVLALRPATVGMALRPNARPAARRASLMGGAASLRLVDSS
jgi:hypothetical protein